MNTLENELKDLLNRYSEDNAAITPDFILAQYLCDCLEAYNKCIHAREAHLGARVL